MKKIVGLLIIVGIALYFFMGPQFHKVKLSLITFRQPATLVRPSFVLEDLSPTAPQPKLSFHSALSHQISSGETLGLIAKKYSIPADDLNSANQVISEMAKKSKEKLNLVSRKKIQFLFDDQFALKKLEYEISPGKSLQITKDSAGKFKGEIVQLPRYYRERVGVGVIRSSFAASAHQAGISYDIVDDLVDLYASRVDFNRDLQKNDRFTIIYREEVLSDGSVISVGPILAAAMDIHGKRLVAARYQGPDGKPRYFDKDGKLLGDTFLRFPLKFSRISSTFSTSRFHPVLRTRRPHNGVDFAAPTGTPVRAVSDGQVELAGYNGPNGNMVKIKHNPRYTTAYVHLSKISPGVRRNSFVKRGQVIGAVGATGLATGPHLHYAMYDYGKYIDPLKAKLPMIDSVDEKNKIAKNYLAKLLLTLDHYQQLQLVKK
jgi:murein DD-endopeptidase MepM/ murein hydrolase activator NlpD